MIQSKLTITTVKTDGVVTAYKIKQNGKVYTFDKQNVEFDSELVVTKAAAEVVDTSLWTKELFEEPIYVVSEQDYENLV